MSDGGRRLRSVRIQRALVAFQRLGYQVVRVRGSHYVLKHATKGMLVLPFHRGTVKVGLLMDALEKAEISVEEFEELL
ncbi:MAG: type II toxin-antitoxin system HicA family toxin [Chloroflexi bacterium]|nr:type II toxin-antitoxin system HicA family toxin [Chloroflexota bacterium]